MGNDANAIAYDAVSGQPNNVYSDLYQEDLPKPTISGPYCRIPSNLNKKA